MADTLITLSYKLGATDMTKIALIGAGGKMGIRRARNLMDTDFDVAHVEISETGQHASEREHAAETLRCKGQVSAHAGARHFGRSWQHA